MDKNELAKVLNGREYGNEIDRELEQAAKESELVVVFGASDDLMEFRGWVNEELDAYNGTTAFFGRDGLIERQCNDKNCPYEEKRRKEGFTVEAVWGREYASWEFETDIDHSTFKVMEDGEVFCVGIVFGKEDVEELARKKRQHEINPNGQSTFNGMDKE